MSRLAWFEDFNDPVERTDAPPDELCAPLNEPPDPRIEGWNEGFLAGYRRAVANAASAAPPFAADLDRRVAEIERSLNDRADEAAALVAGLLIDMIAAACPDDAALQLQPIVDAIRPLFVVEPRLNIHAAAAGEIAFRDLGGLYRALAAFDWEAAQMSVSWSQPTPELIAPALRRAIDPAPATAASAPPRSPAC